jgi:hypothetical protein
MNINNVTGVIVILYFSADVLSGSKRILHGIVNFDAQKDLLQDKQNK